MMYWQRAGEMVYGLMCIHVDDIFAMGAEEFERTVLVPLRECFPIGDERIVNFAYLGLQVETSWEDSDMVVTVNQQEYVYKLEPIDAEGTSKQDVRKVGGKLDEAYRSLVGAMLWATSQTRTDIAFLVQGNPNFQQWSAYSGPARNGLFGRAKGN